MKERPTRPWPVPLLAVSAVLVTAWAIGSELRKPRDEREWHGRVGGVIPYDLRLPTAQRYRERLWAPENPRVIVPRVFGVGWTVNLGRLAKLVRRRRCPTG